MLNYPRALWNPGMQTEEEQAIANYISPSSLHWKV